jgi:flagellar M-ring protein FliF
MIDIDRVDGRVRASSVKRVGEIVDKHPEESLAIVRSWLHSET